MQKQIYDLTREKALLDNKLQNIDSKQLDSKSKLVSDVATLKLQIQEAHSMIINERELFAQENENSQGLISDLEK